MGCEASRNMSSKSLWPKPQPGGKETSKAFSWSQKLNIIKEYSIGDMLGQGAFSIVCNCTRRSSGEVFAVKMIDQTENERVRIRKEVDILSSMEHPNIVKFHGVYYHRYFMCIVMDKYNGGDLVDGIHLHLKENGLIPCQKVVHVLRQIGNSVAYLHSRHVVHRDIKGDNYLMDRKSITNPECKIALADFGTACKIKSGQRLSVPVGTQLFWAPEIFDQDYGLKVDVWAMGIVMSSVVNGCFPFRDSNEIRTKEVKMKEQVNPIYANLIMNLLDKKEASRPESSAVMEHEWLTPEGTKELGIVMV